MKRCFSIQFIKSPKLDKEAHAIYGWDELSSATFIYLLFPISLVRDMERAILLQIGDITAKKCQDLKDFSVKATAEFNRLWIDRDFCNTPKEFHDKTFSESKERTGFNVQVYACLERAVWMSNGQSKGITVKFNVPRNCKTFSTKSHDFVELGTYPRNRVAAPIAKNGNWQRYKSLLKNGWVCKTFGLTSDLQIVAYLSREDPAGTVYSDKRETKLKRLGAVDLKKNVLGIDVNSKCFAVSVISPEGKILHQDYFGKDIWVRRKKIFERKSSCAPMEVTMQERHSGEPRLRNTTLSRTE